MVFGWLIFEGGPPAWTPLKGHPDLPEDKGQYLRDINAARYPRFPMEPSIRALLTMNPDFDTAAVDVVGCGNTVGNLLRFANSQERSFRFIAQVVGETLFMIRKEKSPKQLIENVRGFGHTFPENYTSWEPALEGSVSHQRLVRYKIGTLNCVVRAEADGYLKDRVISGIDEDVDLSESVHSVPEKDSESILEHTGFLTIGEQATDEEANLMVKLGGHKIPQKAVFDLKTRSSRGGEIDMGEIHPRLCISQTPNFIVAYHEPAKGVFKDIRIQDQEAQIQEWIERNQGALSRLEATLNKLRNLSRQQPSKVVEVWRIGAGPLQLRKPLEEPWHALPPDLQESWTKGPLAGT